MGLFSQLFATAAMAAITATAQAQSVRQQAFPTSLLMEDNDIEWQRDIYRELDINRDENASLFSPTLPPQDQEGLFYRLFNMAVSGDIPIYKYSLDGNEVLDGRNLADIRDVMENHHIDYSDLDSCITVQREDIPMSGVMSYYIRESVCYDRNNSVFRTRVTAICPVLIEEDDFYNEKIKYPLFWVDYSDIEPVLKEMTVIPDYRNRATVVSMADFFARNFYKGEIYKVGNALGRTLRQTADTDSAYKSRQQHIEQELLSVQKKTYNTYYRSAEQTAGLSQGTKKQRKGWNWNWNWNIHFGKGKKKTE